MARTLVMKSLIEHIVTEVAATTFFRELSFTSQQFSLSDGTTEELADLFVWMQSDGIVFQVKERAEDASNANHDFEKWFKKKVVGQGSDQIAATLSFFKNHPSIKVKNCRGIEFELNELDSARMHKVIVFGTLADGVEQHGRPKFHQSKRSGFIHLIQVVDFTNLLHWTATPGEMLTYLRFREEHLSQYKEAWRRTEKWLFGSFVHWSASGQVPKLLHVSEGEHIIESLKDDAADVDLRQFLDFIGEWAAQRPGNRKAFPQLVIECAYLSRAGFREFKRRIKKCLSRLDQPAPKSLYRILNGERDCVFAFGVLPPHPVKEVEIGAANFTYLLKYECRVPKAVGFFFTPFGPDDTGTTPVYLEMPWQEDSDAKDTIEKLGTYIRPLNREMGIEYTLNDLAE